MNETTKTQPLISVVIPVYEESDHIRTLLDEIDTYLESPGLRYEVIVVDDGSRDNTWEVLDRAAAERPALRAIRLTRNYGKEMALSAGLDIAGGGAVIVMDGDGQHPPALLPEMIRRWREERAEVVEAVKRMRPSESIVNRMGARLFYWLLGRSTEIDMHGATDFKLLDRRVIEAWQSMGERLPFFRGMIAWLGFRRSVIPFEVPERKGGGSRWSTGKLVSLLINGITSFTTFPLRLVTVAGVVFFVFALIMGVQTLYMKLSGRAVSGFTTVILLLLLIGAVIMFALGIMGEYIANVYTEVKRRPRYIVAETRNLPQETENS